LRANAILAASSCAAASVEGVADLRQHHGCLGLVRGLLDPAGAHQCVGEREGEVGFVRRVIASVLQHADRFIKPSGPRQPAPADTGPRQLRVRVHNRLRGADASRVFLLADPTTPRRGAG
jgi:hypothetical protein